MKVLHITYFDNGGAGNAALRLHNGLLSLNIESQVLVLQKNTKTPEVYEMQTDSWLSSILHRICSKFGFPLNVRYCNYRRYSQLIGEFEFFSFANSDYTTLSSHPLVKECDVINLHWVANYLDYTSFFRSINKPIVWTMHDMNAFQGGFHYKEDEIRNKKLLGKIDKEQFDLKKSAIDTIAAGQLALVSPSLWMKREAEQSVMFNRFRHYHIPNGVDPGIFFLKDQLSLKKKLGLAEDKITVLFVAEHIRNIRKGFSYIEQILDSETFGAYCEFIAVGDVSVATKRDNIRYLGRIDAEEDISDVYSAADIYLLPSREDNLPNVMLESLASGTPVVAFKVGGIQDLVREGFNGCLSVSVSADGLKEALLRCIKKIDGFDKHAIAEHIARNYNTTKQAVSYISLYQDQICSMTGKTHYNESYPQTLVSSD